MQQKVSLIGVRNIAGVSSKNGKPYSFWKATAIEQVRIGGVVALGAGFEPREFDLSEQAFNFLKSQGFPIDVDAELEMDRDNKLRIVTVQPVKPVQVGSARAVNQ